jgi:hypothetical protein
MSKVEFIAVNETARPTDRRILVFLWPQTVPDNAVFRAWQVLSPPLGCGQARCEYGGRIAVCAGDPASLSALVEAAPGSRFAAGSRNGQGPQLALVGRNGSGGAAAVENTTAAPLSVTWHCDGRPILEERDVQPGATAGLELEPDLLLFSIAVPSPTGRYTAAEVAAAPYRYVIPRDAEGAPPKTVHVLWRRDAAGIFWLEFEPPSAAPPPAPAAPPPADAFAPPAETPKGPPAKYGRRKSGERK